jgi:hypothetical protein
VRGGVWLAGARADACSQITCALTMRGGRTCANSERCRLDRVRHAGKHWGIVLTRVPSPPRRVSRRRRRLAARQERAPNDPVRALLLPSPNPSNSPHRSSNIQRDPSRLKAILADPSFTTFFGAPRPAPDGERQSIFGRDDELKNAPKGVAKDHPEIALLRCRTFAVAHRFTDKEVLEPAFAERVGEVAEVMRPFVHWWVACMVAWGGALTRAV